MSEINRRRFIGGIASGAILLAGCSGTANDQSAARVTRPPPTSEPEPTSEPTPDPVAEEHLDAASEAIEIAFGDLSSELDELDRSLDYVDFRTKDISAQIDRAEDELDSAESSATNEQLRLVESVRSMVEWLRTMTDALAAYSEALDAMERGDTYWENERFVDGAEQYETALGLLEEAEEHLVRADDAFDAIDIDPFEGGEDDIVRAREIMEHLDASVVGMSYYARGGRDGMEGFEQFKAASAMYNGERYAEAANLFERAREKFDSAHATLREGEDVAPDWLLETLIDLTCMTGAYRDASAHARVGMEAADAGDSSGEQAALNAAGEALNRCG